MSEVSKDQDQETSYKETFRWNSSIESKIHCRVILLFCISVFQVTRMCSLIKDVFASDCRQLYFLQGVQQRRGGVHIC